MLNSVSSSSPLAIHLPSTAHSLSDVSTGILDVRAFLASMDPLREREYITWTERKRKDYGPDVFDYWLDRYRTFEHRYLYEIQPSDVLDLASKMKNDRREHALGNARRTDGHKKIQDLSAPPPLSFAFHVLLEAIRRIPRWTEFLQFLERNPKFFHDVFYRFVGFDNTDRRYDIDGVGDMAGLRYRLGNAYYSFLKEIYTLSTLRHVYNIDARYHFLIDAVWKTDIYAGDVLLEIYVGNLRFKKQNSGSSGSGRKILCRDINPHATVLELESEVRKDFGSCWLATDDGLRSIAMDTIRAGAPRILRGS